ncbi:putative spermidine/putrescine transport system ATP-binding protein [Mesorhizobium sp. NFR06]|jgi:putative spermidine/putrescine transport system ATP-binding protein|uniref:ABC transporter ATP-binding protein n=1 Tax=Mesorhizobium sp. NFR06 TaxID=1566290 RepID=UPI0008EF7933|nr:ABC transporter ATP-binding protein [Mesorhizobium sp. NFR06]SFQ20556.1 putative spermidine/putrescine transport system ATP-binding protein [Mesorhizobium sp. NFR06]
MASPRIALEKVRKVYGRHVALDDVSVDVRPGEFLTLLGPSGSGKTTLLMAIAGFVRPEAGLIRIGDADVTRLPVNKRDIGIVFQNYALFPHMSVLSNVEYPLLLRRLPRAEARERAQAALARTQLEGYDARDIAALSGGQRQRVALARAVVFEPRVLLMDEPLSALDKNLREQMQFEIRKLQQDLAITTVYVTHDQREALTMSDRIAVMNAGRIEQLDAPQPIYQCPTSRFVADFMGESNILPAAFLEPLGSALPLDGTLVIRAENLSLEREAADGDGVAITGRVTAHAFRGETWHLRLEVEGERQLLLSIPSGKSFDPADIQIGQQLTAYAAARHIHRLDGGPEP